METNIVASPRTIWQPGGNQVANLCLLWCTQPVCLDYVYIRGVLTDIAMQINANAVAMFIRRFRGSKRAKTLFLLLPIVLIYGIYSVYKKYDRNREERSLMTAEDRNANKLKYKLVIVVVSGPANVKERNAVRRSWMSERRNDVRNFFAIGTLRLDSQQTENLEAEDKRHGDLLLINDLEDSYEALTTKILRSFSLVREKFDFEYLLKCDDDSLVLVDKLLEELGEWELEGTRKELYWGFFSGNSQIMKSGPWKETDWVLCDYYLPYALGGGYVLSYKLVEFIAQNSEILRRYNCEDVSVGLWLAPLANIERKHDVRFDTEYQSRGCSNEFIVTHKQSPKSMDALFENYKASGALCVEEVRHREGYKYDWTVPPSKCCNTLPGIL